MSITRRDILNTACLVVMLSVAVALTLPRFLDQSTSHADLGPGKHLQYVFVAPTASGNSELADVVSESMQSVAATATKLSYAFSTVGISGEWDVQRGVELLGSYGVFDEIIVGRNFMNTGKQTYIWRQDSVPHWSPQILLVTQEVSISEMGYQFTDAEVLYRVSTGEEIRRWRRAGYPIPAEEPHSNGVTKVWH